MNVHPFHTFFIKKAYPKFLSRNPIFFFASFFITSPTRAVMALIMLTAV